MNFDISINITRPFIPRHTGHRSKYVNTEHPGSGNKIKGWQWDKYIWPSYSELSPFSYIPTLFDLKLNLPENYYQSGFGNKDDIKLKELRLTKENSLRKWVPIVNTGYYYIHDAKWYLFSDEHITEYLTLDGSNYHTLGMAPKAFKPIFIGNYKRDTVFSRIKINQELKFNIALNADKTIKDPEEGQFITTYDAATTNHRIKANPGTISNETESFEIKSTTETIELSIFPVSDTLVSILNNEDDVSSHWTLSDKDLGILTRNDSDADSLDNKTVTIVYTPKLFVKYEPEFSSEEIAGMKANVNPLHVGTNMGFVQVTTEILDPFEIDLKTDLTAVYNPDTLAPLSYELNLGNNTAKMEATVLSKTGTPLEGAKVYFDWEGQLPDGYGITTDDVSSISDGEGKAFMFYNSPNSINDLGVFKHKTEFTYDGTDSTISISDITPSDVNDVFIYQVRHDDEFYGLDSTEHSTYYANYFSDEQIIDSTATKDYEEKYRYASNQSLNHPNRLPIEITDISSSSTSKVGQKRMIFKTTDTDSYVHPNTGERADETNFFAPLKPISCTENSGTYTIVYNEQLNNVSDVYKYFVVSSKKVKLRAWTTNEAGQKIYSNEINITVKLPDSINGVYYAAVLNAIPAQLLRTINSLPFATLDDLNPSTYAGPSDLTDSSTVVDVTTLDGSPAYIPLGLKIKGSAITIAALLDQVTFLTKE